MNWKICLALDACLGLAACKYTLTPGERMTAENGARSYTERLSGKYLSCSATDSDSGGYVTCGGTDGKSSAFEMLCSYQEGAPGRKLK